MSVACPGLQKSRKKPQNPVEQAQLSAPAALSAARNPTCSGADKTPELNANILHFWILSFLSDLVAREWFSEKGKAEFGVSPGNV